MGHEHPDLRANNIEELKKALGHLSARNAARESVLIEVDRTRPDPIEVQAARLELVVAALVPDEMQRLFLEYTWQQRYSTILGGVEEQVRQAATLSPDLNPPEQHPSTGE